MTQAYPRRGKRRATHNEAERRRARRINDQISRIKELVSEEGIVPGDKHGILTAAADTIRDLRARLYQTKERITPSALVPTSMPTMLPVDFRTLYLTMPTPSTMVSVDGTFLTCTKAFSELSGIGMSDLGKHTMFSLTVPSELPNMYKIVGELMSGTSSVSITKRCRFKTHVCNVAVEMSVLHEGGRHVGFACTLSTDKCKDPFHGRAATTPPASITYGSETGSAHGGHVYSEPVSTGDSVSSAGTSPRATHEDLAVPPLLLPEEATVDQGLEYWYPTGGRTMADPAPAPAGEPVAMPVQHLDWSMFGPPQTYPTHMTSMPM